MVRGLARAVRAAAKAVSSESREEDGELHEPASGPRAFSFEIKEACWRNAVVVKGRDPARWRRDPLGNLVFRKLVGCNGCLCHSFDHIVPYSKGGKSVLDNCQVLQVAANSAKGNRSSVSTTELMQRSVYCRLSGRDMDIMELSAYGDVHHEDEGFGGCKIQ